jgi:Exostosin family
MDTLVAPHDAPKLCLVVPTWEDHDLPLVPELERALIEIGCKVEVVRFPFFWAPTTEGLNSLRALLRKKSAGQFLIFGPDNAELFLKEPDLTLAYSAYRGWYNSEKIRVIPHLWGPTNAPESTDHLAWSTKPPLRIGFMGTSHETSRLAQIVRVSPKWIRTWFLNGKYLRFPRLRALMNDRGFSTQHISAFARMEALNIVKQKSPSYSGVELEIVERQDFTGSQQERDEYIDCLSKNTYILCPRGSENFSFRMYEALSFGRVPVIIDTNMVLPPEVNWDRLAVRVPYGSIDNILGLIQQDYNRQSEAAFLARQQESFSVMADLRTMRWVRALAHELVQHVNAQGSSRRI